MIQSLQGYLSIFTVKGYYYILTCKLHLSTKTLSSYLCPFAARTKVFYIWWLKSVYYFIYAWVHIPFELVFCSTVILYSYTWPIHNCIFIFSFKLIRANTIQETVNNAQESNRCLQGQWKNLRKRQVWLPSHSDSEWIRAASKTTLPDLTIKIPEVFRM